MSLVTTLQTSPPAGSPLLVHEPEACAPQALRGEIDIALDLRHAGRVQGRLRYELAGAAHLPVVLVAGGISAHRHVAANGTFAEPGWANALVSAGRTLDPRSRRILAIDYVGADGLLDAPIDTADQADAIAQLLDALQIEALYAFVGYSYGALVGLQLAVRHPSRLRRLIAVSGAHRAHPYAAAWRALQRRAVALGQLQCADAQGLSLARQLAMLSYRTPEEFGERFDAPPEIINGRVRCAAEDYLDAAGAQYVARTPVTAYLRLSESIDLHRVDPADVAVPTTVVAVEGDRLVPLADSVALVEGLGTHGQLRVLRSPYGHDAFLKETDRIDAVLASVLGATARAIHTSAPCENPHRSHRMNQPTCSLATAAVRAGIDRDTAYGAVTPPIVLSSNFSFEGFGQKRQYDYTRSGNPTRDLLAEALAELEGGAGAVITSTGMAAITLVLNALLQPGERLVVPHDAYGGSWRLFNALAKKGHFELVTADLTDPRSLADALAQSPRLVLIETPSNPLLRITDLRFVIEAAHKAGALTVVDNTFLSPALQRPLEFGADVVLHSTTKYINGHSDVVGGAVVAREAALHQQLAWWANALGLTGAPFDSFLTLRGLRTLDARLRVHQENTAAIAALLDGHPAVSKVYYPGLASHPGHAVAARQQAGFGAMLSVELHGGEGSVRAFVDGLRYFTLAESLGGVESLIAHPATMTHAAMSAEARAHAGISDGLLRLSIGIESARDLVADLELGLERAQRAEYAQASARACEIADA